MLDNLFGGLFYSNGDGHADFAEEAIGFAVMEEMMSREDSTDDFDTEDEW